MSKIDLPGEKKVGHLTLLRTPRAIGAKEFNALTAAERLDIVRRLPGKQKYRLILEAADAESLVRRLPAQEIYLLIKELGLDNAAELVALASTEQITAFLDLDCWDRDQLDEKSALPWLALLLEVGEEKVVETAREMEFELLVLIASKLVTITRGPEALLDEDALHERTQMDAIYDVEYADSETAKIVGAFLDILHRHDRDLYIGLMEAVRWESFVELEENAYRFRVMRLQDRGFPDPFEAAGIYAWLDPETFDPARQPKIPLEPGEEGVEAPGFFLSAVPAAALLAEVLAGGISDETAWELSFLVNKAMAADRVDVGEPSQVHAEMEESYRYLNLGLEHLSGGSVDKAARLFGQAYIEHLFRVGFSLTLRLRERAQKIQGSLVAPYLDGPFRAFLDGLLRKKPRLFEGAEDETRAGERPFATLRDIRLAEEWLDRLEVQRRLFAEHFPFELPAPAALDLSGCYPDQPDDLTLSDLFLTALANRVLGREFLPRPVPAEELAALHARVCTGGKVVPALREETARWLESLFPGAAAFGDYCLNLWTEELCALKSGELDPRYVGGVIVRLGGR